MYQIYLGNQKIESDPHKMILNFNQIFGPIQNLKQVLQIFNYLDNLVKNKKTDYLEFRFRNFFLYPQLNSQKYFLNFLKDKWTQIKESKVELKLQINSFRYYQVSETNLILDSKTLSEWKNLLKSDSESYDIHKLILWYYFETHWSDQIRLKRLIEEAETKPQYPKQLKFRPLFEKVLEGIEGPFLKMDKIKNRLVNYLDRFSQDRKIIQKVQIREQLFHQVENDLKLLRKYFPKSEITLEGSSKTSSWLKELALKLKYKWIKN